ncbi:MAG TPA: hypothetical protein VI077_09320, partial [Pseudolabrys sp.]
TRASLGFPQDTREVPLATGISGSPNGSSTVARLAMSVRSIASPTSSLSRWQRGSHRSLGFAGPRLVEDDNKKSL